MCLDPITMQPDRLLFTYWRLTEQVANLNEKIKTIIRFGYAAIRADELKKTRIARDRVYREIEECEKFIAMTQLSGMEIYS